MDELLRFDHHDVRPGTRYVTLTGEADLSTIEQLQHDLRRLLAPRWVTHLKLNLKTLRFLDCAAFSVLLGVRETALTRGQRVTVTAARGGPARVIALSGSGHLFNYSTTVQIGDTRRPAGRDLVALG
ncbi:STAS domain-containing protein [Micromonospora sp. NPDC051196]|uniref:STAS domain-containing protein n=1 Tax=Micromonospora sp. NPDC051196 TaxID=3155281 RepID=UPI00342BE71E